jgi:HPt (histidine-containing phosphotransfer) domain-containing protein
VLDRVQGDTVLLAELVGILRLETRPLLEAIAAGLDAGDANAVEGAAHRLRGAVATFGAPAATAAAERLESMGRDGQLGDTGHAALDELERAMSALLNDLAIAYELSAP